MSALVMPCTCQHNYQDKHYGAGMRVHNMLGENAGWRCTVCANKKGAVKKEVKKEEKK